MRLQAKSTKNNFEEQLKRCLEQMPLETPEKITVKDLEKLPAPVRKYLEYVGVLGTEKVNHFEVEIEGEFKMSQDRDWDPVLVQQVSIVNNPVRLFFMKLKFWGLNVFGLHHYESASASMVIKVLDLFKVADARGQEMNQGETVTVFNDMCILSPSTLIDQRISWKEIDDLTVQGTFTNGEYSVSAILHFNEQGQLVNFISDDRFYWKEDNTYEQIRWSTPVGNYREINGLNLATYGEAIWHKEDGLFPYAKFNVRNVRINPDRGE